MSLYVYNTLSHNKEVFETVKPGKVSIYTCGLTVQDYCHIGHARMDIIWDCIKNWLRYRGYEVQHIQNFTDINEKIANKALEAGITATEWAERYIEAYYQDMRSLGIKGADRYVKVSEEMAIIQDLIQTLIDKGHAYERSGSVYFRVASYPNYGRLSGRRTEELDAGARISINAEKESPEDFALWTVAQPGEPIWPSPWGEGTPGWHIECSAMSMHYLGQSYDMHGGGIDIIFPHHENELAQSCAAHEGDPESYARYWVHHGVVLAADGSKMSKSMNNFFRVRDILKEFPAWILRFYVLSSHYRSPITFSPEMVAESSAAFGRLKRVVSALKKVEYTGGSALDISEMLIKATQDIEEAMDDDFNTAQAIAVLFEMTRLLNNAIQENALNQKQASAALSFFDQWSELLGFAKGFEEQEDEEVEPIDPAIQTLIDARQEARAHKNWAEADAIRAELDKLGIIITDTPQGVTWKRK